VEDGLKTNDKRSPTGFAIAGDDRKFYWADAKIEGTAVVVSSPKVPNPVAVRYGWLTIQTVTFIMQVASLPSLPDGQLATDRDQMTNLRSNLAPPFTGFGMEKRRTPLARRLRIYRH